MNNVNDIINDIENNKLKPLKLGYSKSVTGNLSNSSHSLIDTPPKLKNGYPDVDLKKFPLYAKAKFKKYILKSNDILLIPSEWGHLVYSENSVSLSFFNFTNETFPKLSKFNWLNNSSWESLKSDLKSTDFTSNCGISPYNYFYPYLKYNDEDIKRWHSSVIILLKTFYILVDIFKKDHKNFNMLFFSNITNNDNVYNIIKKHIDFSLLEDMKHEVWFWCKSGKTVTGLHRDNTPNYLHCLSGKMTVFLYPPTEMKYLYYSKFLHYRNGVCKDKYLHNILLKYSESISYDYNPDDFKVIRKSKKYIKYLITILIIIFLIYFVLSYRLWKSSKESKSNK